MPGLLLSLLTAGHNKDRECSCGNPFGGRVVSLSSLSVSVLHVLSRPLFLFLTGERGHEETRELRDYRRMDSCVSFPFPFPFSGSFLFSIGLVLFLLTADREKEGTRERERKRKQMSVDEPKETNGIACLSLL